MADLTITAAVTNLAGTLTLENPGAYRVVSFAPGGRSWRRERVTSPDEHGADLINATLDVTTIDLVIEVFGSSDADLHTKTAALVNAFSQNAYYTLTVTINGQAWTYNQCEPADIALVDGTLDKFGLTNQRQVYRMSIPRNPIPAAGPL